MRVSRAIGAHQNASGLFAALVDELNGPVDCDAIGVFVKCQNSDCFQNHLVDMESRSVLVAEENLSPEDTFVSAVYEAIELRDLGELSTAETAGIMKVSVGAVKARLFHGRKKLRVKLKRYLESMSSQETKQRQRAVRPRAFRRRLASSACD